MFKVCSECLKWLKVNLGPLSLRIATHCEEFSQCVEHVFIGNTATNLESQTLLCKLINDGKPHELGTSFGAIEDEIPTSYIVRMLSSESITTVLGTAQTLSFPCFSRDS